MQRALSCPLLGPESVPNAVSQMEGRKIKFSAFPNVRVLPVFACSCCAAINKRGWLSPTCRSRHCPDERFYHVLNWSSPKRGGCRGVRNRQSFWVKYLKGAWKDIFVINMSALNFFSTSLLDWRLFMFFPQRLRSFILPKRSEMPISGRGSNYGSVFFPVYEGTEGAVMV